MELGQYQMQIFLSLVVILGAALVALVCDLLKGNNEQLRELAIELKVRREEESKRFQMLAPRPMTEPAAVESLGAISQKAEAVNSAAKAAPQIADAAAAADSRTSHRKEARGSKEGGKHDEKKRAIAPEALAAMQRGAHMATAPKIRRTPDRVPVERPEVESV